VAFNPVPVVRTVVAEPAVQFIPAPIVRTLVQPTPLVRVLTSHDCVTVGGCEARLALAAHGRTVKREAEAEPQYLINPYANAGFGYNNLYSGYHNNFYNPYAYNTHNAFPYGNGYAPYNVAPAPLAVAHAPALVEAVPALIEAAPAPIVTLRAAPVPILEAAPAPLPIFRQHLLPAVRALRPVPVVETRAKHVTYTHLGAHPIQPTTVVQHDTRQVGITLAKREAEAEPQYLINPYANAGFGYNNLYSGYHNNFYNPYAYNTHNAFPYGNGYAPYNVAPAPLAVAHAPALVEAVPALIEAAPAPIVTLRAAPVPILEAAPVPLPIFRQHLLPAVRALRPVPVVETRAKHVTYTHLGAHPIQPTTVVQHDTRQVGVALA
jgi:hypothetical protein